MVLRATGFGFERNNVDFMRGLGHHKELDEILTYSIFIRTKTGSNMFVAAALHVRAGTNSSIDIITKKKNTPTPWD